MSHAKDSGTQPVPVHLRNAPTRLMKDWDMGMNTATRTMSRMGTLREKSIS